MGRTIVASCWWCYLMTDELKADYTIVLFFSFLFLLSFEACVPHTSCTVSLSKTEKHRRDTCYCFEVIEFTCQLLGFDFDVT
jgi:apolipoprotein N-acyltransferase